MQWQKGETRGRGWLVLGFSSTVALESTMRLLAHYYGQL